MTRWWMLAVALMLGPAAAEVSDAAAKPFEPCASASAIVRRSLAGKAPAELPRWPLYETELEVGEGGRDVAGRLRVSLAAVESQQEVSFVLPSAREPAGLYPMRVVSAASNVGEGEPIPTEAAYEADAVRVPLPRAARAGERVVVELGLGGDLPMRSTGLLTEGIGALQPGGEVGTVGTLATDGVGVTLLTAYPTLAVDDGLAASRWGAPPAAPVACHLGTVVASASLSLSVTGAVVGTVPADGGERTRHAVAAAGVRRLAIVLRPDSLETITVEEGAVRIRVRASDRKRAREVAGWASRAVALFAQRWGPYPWKRLEVVAAPMHGAFDAQRGPGVVAFNSLLDAELDGPMRALAADQQNPGREAREFGVVREIAHQWAGELAGSRGPSEPVIEEMVAQWGVLEYARARYGEKSARGLAENVMSRVYRVWRGMGGSDAAADRPTAELGSDGWIALAQGKSPHLLLALDRTLGRAAVRKGLRRWLQDGRWRVVGRAELEEALAASAPAGKREQVPTAFRHWLDEANGDTDLGPPEGGFEAMGRMGNLPPGFDEAQMRRMMEAAMRALMGGP